jgi:hypothetical protein
MNRNPQLMPSAKTSKIEKLHAAFTNTLADILATTGIETPASALSVIRSFLADSGVKPVSDSPAHKRLMNSFDSLPFTTEDAPTTAPDRKPN